MCNQTSAAVIKERASLRIEYRNFLGKRNRRGENEKSREGALPGLKIIIFGLFQR
jgi:hypothetical protein